MLWETVSKALLKVKVDHIQSLSLMPQAHHFVIEGDQVRQAGPAFHKLMLTGPDRLPAHSFSIFHIAANSQLTLLLSFSLSLLYMHLSIY